MPHVTLPISSPGGPILDLGIAVSEPHERALRAANKPVPPPVRIRALVDTGASGTCVDPTCLKSLGLTSKGQTPIRTPSTGATPHFCDQYDVSIILLHKSITLRLAAVPIIASDLAIQGIQALLGRDVLSRCLLVYDGSAGSFTLSF